ncbi:MAG: DinB family protein [Chthonomonadales bacterium]
MDDQRRGWIEAYRESIVNVSNFASHLDDEIWNRKAKRAHWTIGQSIGHINRSNGMLIRAIELALENETPVDDQSTWKPRLLEKLFLVIVGGKRPFPVPVPPIFEPDTNYDLKATVAEFKEIHESMIKCVEASSKFNLNKVTVASAAQQKMTFTLGCWFESTRIHDAYHIQQAQETLDELNGVPKLAAIH